MPENHMSEPARAANRFTEGPLAGIFARTALPIIFVMGMNGLLAVVDAIFLGVYVGPAALGAVTLMFPLYMLIVALATLVASGMSSQLARHLGAARIEDARRVYAGAHGLAMLVSAVLIVLFALCGGAVTLLVAAGNVVLAEMGHTYLRLSVWLSPLSFVMAVQADALRNEGRVGLMAATSLAVSLLNIGFNWVMIARLGLGVAGSVIGTALAQVVALAVIVAFRLWGRTDLGLDALRLRALMAHWPRTLALGAPQSLGFVGLALGSGAIIAALQLVETRDYQVTVSAYGIITRVMAFVFLPLLGLSHALQSIVGNNFGAALWQRSDNSLRLGIGIAFAYCLAAELGLSQFAAPIGGMFVDDPAVVGAMARILPVMVALFVLAGPVMMIAAYFQAIGDAPRAGVLSLAKPFGFAVPLTFLLPLGFGERGIWMAGPVAEALLFALTLVVLGLSARRRALRWGLFRAGPA